MSVEEPVFFNIRDISAIRGHPERNGENEGRCRFGQNTSYLVRESARLLRKNYLFAVFSKRPLRETTRLSPM